MYKITRPDTALPGGYQLRHEIERAGWLTKCSGPGKAVIGLAERAVPLKLPFYVFSGQTVVIVGNNKTKKRIEFSYELTFDDEKAPPQRDPGETGDLAQPPDGFEWSSPYQEWTEEELRTELIARGLEWLSADTPADLAAQLDENDEENPG